MGTSLETSQHLGATKGRRRIMIIEDDADLPNSSGNSANIWGLEPRTPMRIFTLPERMM